MQNITDRIRAVMRHGCTHEQLLGDVIAEIERLQADASRYRWLRHGCDEKWSRATHIAANYYGSEWDAAIDAAMKGE
mgnify:CR=1 FL=1